MRRRRQTRTLAAMAARIVVITGSAGGIGTALMQHFSSLGDTPVGLDLAGVTGLPDEAATGGSARSGGEAGGSGEAGGNDGFDVSVPADCEAAVERIVAEHGRIDVLCNNAGIGAVGDVVASTPEEWQRVFGVNVFGIANMCRAALPVMRGAGRGAIVNTCSVVASVGLVERAVYAASKGAVLALTRSMAADEVAHGIRVNCVSPGTVQSPWVERLVEQSADPEGGFDSLRRRQPLGRLVSCEEVAAAVAYLADDNTFTTGADFLLDGGITGVRIVR